MGQDSSLCFLSPDWRYARSPSYMCLLASHDPVSLQQMVLFGQNPNQGTLLKASQFLHEELPVRLAHRVKELDELPHQLSKMPSIIKVKNWYAQSFEVCFISAWLHARLFIPVLLLGAHQIPSDYSTTIRRQLVEWIKIRTDPAP